MDNIRIDLGKDEQGNAQFWDIKAVQTYGMRKQIKKQAQAALTEKMRMEQSRSADSMSMEVIDMMELTEQIENQTLLVCSAGWSWPDAITAATLGDRESWMIDSVLKQMNDTYTRTPEQIKALEKN